MDKKSNIRILNDARLARSGSGIRREFARKRFAGSGKELSRGRIDEPGEYEEFCVDYNARIRAAASKHNLDVPIDDLKELIYDSKAHHCELTGIVDDLIRRSFEVDAISEREIDDFLFGYFSGDLTAAELPEIIRWSLVQFFTNAILDLQESAELVLLSTKKPCVTQGQIHIRR